MRFLDVFIEDCKYYDSKNIEVKTILKYVELKGKTILDMGAGIGRLSFPLAKYAEEVIALDKDKRFNEYFKKHNRRNVKFVNEKAEKYLEKKKFGKKFDVILLAWPTFNFKFIDMIKKSMREDSLFIFITCDNNSDFETIVDKLGVVKKGYFNKDISNKTEFIKILLKKFKLLVKKKISTEYVYPNKNIAFRVLKNDMKLFFNIKLNEKAEEKLRELIEKHKMGNKIRFGEKIWFYLLKTKQKFK